MDDPVQVRRLPGLSLRMHPPRVVAHTSSGHCWYPDLLRFATGQLMLTYSLNADANDNPHNSQAVCLSGDGGHSFDFAYDVNGFHNAGGEPRLSLPDGRIVGTSTFLRPDPPGQWRRFAAHHWCFQDGGRRYAVEPWGAHVEGLPAPVQPYPQASRTWWARINWFSDIVALADDHWVSTLSLRFAGDARETTVALSGADGGRSWRYLATIAGPDAVPQAGEGFDEPCLLQLADGDLLCVSRVGSGADQPLARTRSSDGGRTWSPVDRLPAYSVAPQLCRLRSGVLALSTGRPGLFLWLSTDDRGEDWHGVDVMAHHNASVAPAERMTAAQTTAYTAMVEGPSDRLLLVYDRTPFGWQPVPAGSGEASRIYLLEVEVRRE
ncbi:MAG: sialidase family protein [Candidatus Latescibacterota bacterium]